MSALLVLPWPPSINHYWRSVCVGRRPSVYISEEGKQYRVDVLAAVLARWECFKPIRGKIAVSIVACQPNNLRRDIDNVLKAPLDALTEAGVWVDDSQISKLSIEWGPTEKPGKILVTIERLQPPKPEQRTLKLEAA